MKFTTKTISRTLAGQLPENKAALSRKDLIREKLQEDPNMIKRGYEHGWLVFGERVVFVRSRWEANLCAYYEFLKNNGSIKEWEYEKETFWFEGILRGTNNYKPDFRITRMDDTMYRIEVKGYWEKKDTVKMNRMKKYHPSIQMKYIQENEYKEIAEKSAMFPGWDQPFKKREEIQHLLDAQLLRNPPVIKKKSLPKNTKIVL